MSEPTTVDGGDEACGCETVCTLPEQQIGERSEEIRAAFLPHLRGHRASPTKVVWQFDDTPEMHARLDELVDFERQCCSALDFEVAVDAGSTELTLTVTGEGAELFAVDRNRAIAGEEPGGTVSAMVKAGGAGLGISLLLCCVVPMAVAALGGASLVAPLVVLDSPLFIGVGSIVFAIPVWWWMRRSADTSCGAGC